MKRIYFDNAANTNPSNKVLKALFKCYNLKCNNPSSLHKEGRMAFEILLKSKINIAREIGCNKDEIFFVSNSSEAISWVAKMRILDIHPTSHHSFFECLKDFNIKANKEPLLCIPLIDNETGRINDLKEYKNEIFLDLTASIGKVKINLKNYKNVKYACFSAHKFGGTLGAGILYIKKDKQKDIIPLIYGSQESGYRGGTENYPSIYAMSVALNEATKMIKVNNRKISNLIGFFKGNIDENIKFDSHNSIINITFKELNAQTAVLLFDKYGVSISAGSACNSKSIEPSKTLLYYGYSREDALKTIRVSLSHNNTIEEMKSFIKILKIIIDTYDNI